MIERCIGTNGIYVISGSCGAEYQQELKRLKKALKKAGVERKYSPIVTKALVITSDYENKAMEVLRDENKN